MILFGTIIAADKNIIDETNSYLISLGIRPILASLAREMERSRIRQWSVVLGYDHETHRRAVESVSVRSVIDPDWQDGFASYVKVGLREMPPQAEGFIVLPGNLPFFQTNDMNLLIDALEAEKGFIVVPTSEGRIFPYPLFHRRMLGEVLNRLHEGSFLGIIKDHEVDTFEVEISNPIKLLQINDKQSYLQAKETSFKAEKTEEPANPQMEIPE